MPSLPTRHHDFNFQQALSPFAQNDDLPFADVLTATDVATIFAEQQVCFGQTARSFWTPALTLWAFLWQMLSPDQSCRQAVANVLLSLALCREPAGLDTGNYCRARSKLKSEALQRLALFLGQRLEAAAPPAWHWKGRRVKLVDGSTSQLPDTEANQQQFPQPTTQKKGLGYPQIRWVVLIGLATAVIEGFAYGPYAGKETDELALFRSIVAELQAGDVVVADRFYCSYFMVALLHLGGVDVAARLHQRRKYDFSLGEPLGERDHVVEWQRPDRPAWMSKEMYALMPARLRMREIYRKVQVPGWRVKEVVIATTLLDAAEYRAEEIAELYFERWQVELDIRSLKIGLKLDYLRCETPAMVAREIWAHLLAYNLVRKVGAQVAQLAGVTARAISFTAVRQAILGGWQQATQLQGVEYVRHAKAMLRLLRTEKVKNRPGRYEPRKIKRRPKSHKLLREPREAARKKLLQGKGEKEKE